MLGIILTSIGTFFEEISDTIGKNKVLHHEEGTYTMAFLTFFWGTIIFLFIAVFNANAFVFVRESVPTFILRMILEVVQIYVTIRAIIEADRSTFTFMRSLTIPLLLGMDILLGYQIGYTAIIGMTIIVLALIISFSGRSMEKKGLSLVIFSAINSVFTISLFKYNITHYNSIVAEQVISNLILLVIFFFLALYKTKENPIMFLTKPAFFLQSAFIGIGGTLESFAFGFGSASVITAAKRSSSILWALVSGKMYFKEQHIIFKMFIFLLIFTGLIFLAT